MALYIPRSIFHLGCGFCMSGRKLLNPPSYECWNDADKENPKSLEEKPVPMPLFPPYTT